MMQNPSSNNTCRALFGASSDNSASNCAQARMEIEEIRRQKSDEWSFDFVNEEPYPEGQFEWVRPHQELPRLSPPVTSPPLLTNDTNESLSFDSSTALITPNYQPKISECFPCRKNVPACKPSTTPSFTTTPPTAMEQHSTS